MEFRARTASEALPALARAVLKEDSEMASRGGPRVLELLYPHVVLTEPWRREVLTVGRKASLPAQIAETMWVLAGRNDIEWLERYLPRAGEFSDDGKVWRGGYGPRIRRWVSRDHGDVVDQLAFVAEELSQAAVSRRAVINIYDPVVDTQPGRDIPCNDWVHLLSRGGRLHMHVATRSNDLIWGWSGINAFEWSALQEILAGLLRIGIGELHFSISSLHVYDRHWARARALASASSGVEGVHASPRFDGKVLGEGPAEDRVAVLDKLIESWFRLEALIRTDLDDVTLATQIDKFPEPMLRSWLHVLAWYWRGRNESWLVGLRGTGLWHAAHSTPKRKAESPVSQTVAQFTPDRFTEEAVALHNEKHAVYGDSWCKRGEQISILANVARKVDRLGAAGAGDSEADTTLDLTIYLAKYLSWLQGGDAEKANAILRELPPVAVPTSDIWATEMVSVIKDSFDDYQDAVVNDVLTPERKRELVTVLLSRASWLARHERAKALWRAGNADRRWNPDA